MREKEEISEHMVVKKSAEAGVRRKGEKRVLVW